MLSQYKWEIDVSAGAYYPNLAVNFPGNDICFSYEDDQGMRFFAYSNHVDVLDDPGRVVQRIYSLQILVNGALRLGWGKINGKSICFNRCVRFSDCYKEKVFAKSIEEEPFSDKLQKIDSVLHDFEKNKTQYSAYLLSLSKIDGELRSLLFLVGMVSRNSPIENILSWGTLYKILDTVKYHAKNLDIPLSQLADQQKVNAFTAACNNMSILGVYARHGAKGNRTPKNFISDLDEAIDLIISMATKFCKAYVLIKHS